MLSRIIRRGGYASEGEGEEARQIRTNLSVCSIASALWRGMLLTSGRDTAMTRHGFQYRVGTLGPLGNPAMPPRKALGSAMKSASAICVRRASRPTGGRSWPRTFALGAGEMAQSHGNKARMHYWELIDADYMRTAGRSTPVGACKALAGSVTTATVFPSISKNSTL
jgi:hypothetical protein